MGKAKLSDTASFTSFYTPPQATSGTAQRGDWAANTFNDVGLNDPDIPESVPAASRTTVSCADSRFKQVGTKQQYALTLRLTDAGVALVGGLTDAQGTMTTAIDSTLFVFGSSNSLVASIGASSGVIVPRTVGGVSLTVRFPQECVNKPFDGARPVIGGGFSEAGGATHGRFSITGEVVSAAEPALHLQLLSLTWRLHACIERIGSESADGRQASSGLRQRSPELTATLRLRPQRISPRPAPKIS